jgi:hypothetical protein
MTDFGHFFSVFHKISIAKYPNLPATATLPETTNTSALAIPTALQQLLSECVAPLTRVAAQGTRTEAGEREGESGSLKGG